MVICFPTFQTGMDKGQGQGQGQWWTVVVVPGESSGEDYLVTLPNVVRIIVITLWHNVVI